MTHARSSATHWTGRLHRQVLPSAACVLAALALLGPWGAPAQGAMPGSAAAPAPATSRSPANSRSTVLAVDAERVRVVTSDGQALIGSYYAPPASRKKSSERAPGVLLVHAPGEDRSGFGTLAEALNREGFAVLAIDLRGHGESVSEENNWSKLEPEAQANLWTFALRDLTAAAAWLRAKPEVHTSSLSLYGVGNGAGLAAHFALSDEGVHSLTLVEPFCERLAFDLKDDLAELEGMPIRLVADKSKKDAADQLVDALEAKSWLEVTLTKPSEDRSLDDKRLVKDLAKWCVDKSQGRPAAPESPSPSRGRRG